LRKAPKNKLIGELGTLREEVPTFAVWLTGIFCMTIKIGDYAKLKNVARSHNLYTSSAILTT